MSCPHTEASLTSWTVCLKAQVVSRGRKAGPYRLSAALHSYSGLTPRTHPPILHRDFPDCVTFTQLSLQCVVLVPTV